MRAFSLPMMCITTTYSDGALCPALTPVRLLFSLCFKLSSLPSLFFFSQAEKWCLDHGLLDFETASQLAPKYAKRAAAKPSPAKKKAGTKRKASPPPKAKPAKKAKRAAPAKKGKAAAKKGKK